MNIEQLVRPFQSVNVFAGAPRRGPVDAIPGAVLLELGKNASPKTFTGSFSFSSTGFMGKKQNENTRTVQPVAVFQSELDEFGSPIPTDDLVANEAVRAKINATQSIKSKSGRGRNYEVVTLNLNKRAEIQGATVAKDGPTKEFINF